MFEWFLQFISDDSIRDEFTERGLLPGVSNARLKEVCEERNIPRYQDPVEELDTLPDERGRVYVWSAENPETRRSWLDTLAEYQDFNGEFDALHIVVTDEMELHRLERHELEAYL